MGRNYKFHNTVVEGIVFRLEDYKYSSAAAMLTGGNFYLILSIFVIGIR